METVLNIAFVESMHQRKAYLLKCMGNSLSWIRIKTKKDGLKGPHQQVHKDVPDNEKPSID